MNNPKRGPGRPRLPDPAGDVRAVIAEMLPTHLLEARRLYDRLRQRRYRDARRRNRNNPAGLAQGVDGLHQLQEQGERLRDLEQQLRAERALHEQTRNALHNSRLNRAGGR